MCGVHSQASPRATKWKRASRWAGERQRPRLAHLAAAVFHAFQAHVEQDAGQQIAGVRFDRPMQAGGIVKHKGLSIIQTPTAYA